MPKKVLITGIAGTFGKAFTRLLHDKHTVMGVDASEWAVAEFEQDFPAVEVMLGSFDEWDFDLKPVDYVIHCAAFKHAPLGERNAWSFVDNNVVRTRKLFSEALRTGAKILFLSSDKSVEPCNLYGYTKAIGEYLCKDHGGSVARCGNILNSTGSVVPRWEKAIADNLPIPITSERMSRYFIEDADAANQIWYEFIKGEKLIIPKCEEIRIMDLLAKVLEKHGFEKASDYTPGVEVIGVRPNEKIRESLRWLHEEREEA